VQPIAKQASCEMLLTFINTNGLGSLNHASLDVLASIFDLLLWDLHNSISCENFELSKHLVQFLARSIEITTVTFIMERTKDIMKGHKLLENLYRACKKYIAQTYAYFKKTKFITEMRNDILNEI
jgi:hypothetical protein